MLAPMMRGLLRTARRSVLRQLAGQRCIVGAGAVVYSPWRVRSADGDRSRIVVGAETHVRGELMAFAAGRIELGAHCYVGESTRIWAWHEVRIGDRVLISHGVTVVDSLTHPIDPQARHAHFAAITSGRPVSGFDLDARPVVIEDDVWIGCNVVVLRGVTLGAACIVGAGSVVTRDVPARCIVAGNPARVIRQLDPAERIARVRPRSERSPG